ncbi:N-acetylmuramoyl-L-alanine amidase [Bacteroidia bacterium]|nr:N-acetylmuramoyl-L-alanine amidase [Bacteroidia bacterium]
MLNFAGGMKRAFLLVVISALLAIPSAVAKPADGQFVLVIDAGHGGHDPGAIGKKGKEKNVTLAVVLLLGKYIGEQHPDVKIVYTRSTDVFVELDERANIANRNKADLFMSIHTNATTSSAARGSEVYSFGVARTKESLAVTKRENAVIQLEDNYKERYDGFDPNSAESYIIFEFMQNKFVEQSIHFATQVQDKIKNCVSWQERGVKQAQFLVLRKSAMPRILIELGFISNPQEEEVLISESGQQQYATAIGEAFTQYKNEYDRKNGRKPRGVVPIPVEKPESLIDSGQDQRPSEDDNDVQYPIDTMNGRVYKIQILSSPKKLPTKSPKLKGYKVDFYVEKGTYKYTVGESDDKEEIQKIYKTVKKQFTDAFIILFENGRRVK